MARPSRPRIVDSSGESDDSLPDLAIVVAKKKKVAMQRKATPEATQEGNGEEEKPSKVPATVRRRKLGPISDKGLLGGWKPDGATDEIDAPISRASEETKSRKPRVELRARKATPVQATPPPEDENEEDGPSGYMSAKEEATITEELSILDGGFETAQSSASDFEDSLGDFIVDDSDSESYLAPKKPPPKTTLREKTRKQRQTKARMVVSDSEDEEPISKVSEDYRKPGGTSKGLAETFSRLQINDPSLALQPAPPKTIPSKTRPPRMVPRSKETTPPATPPKDKPGLSSPKKLPRIPKTPHRASSDMFWNREFIDDWNDQHSPRKQLFPDPAKASPAKKAIASPKKPAPSARAVKKAFEESKEALAASFLRELDDTITSGRLSELTASTGGIKLNWTNKLNTTAGRASWKRETAARGAAPGTAPTHKHHASIDLSTKVIDDEHRLLNVVAHEFCHLANYMVSGVVNNPHGKEFKAWAARCSAAFGASRGIEVTTKHTYDIDFKYVWQCEECPLLYKRHSKSIDPARHRCGAALCKGVLRQIKPVPRGGDGGEKGDGEGGEKAKKGPTEYQVFMKEEMKRVREQNPGSPQKDVMRIVAGRWKEERERRAGSASRTPTPGVEEMVGRVEVITLEE